MIVLHGTGCRHLPPSTAFSSLLKARAQYGTNLQHAGQISSAKDCKTAGLAWNSHTAIEHKQAALPKLAATLLQVVLNASLQRCTWVLAGTGSIACVFKNNLTLPCYVCQGSLTVASCIACEDGNLHLLCTQGIGHVEQQQCLAVNGNFAKHQMY